MFGSHNFKTILLLALSFGFSACGGGFKVEPSSQVGPEFNEPTPSPSPYSSATPTPTATPTPNPIAPSSVSFVRPVRDFLVVNLTYRFDWSLSKVYGNAVPRYLVEHFAGKDCAGPIRKQEYPTSNSHQISLASGDNSIRVRGVAPDGTQGLGTCSKTVNLTAPDSRTLSTSLTAGYQGWFAASGDGSALGRWNHWSKNSSAPDTTNLKFDIYPDTREYAAADLFKSGFARLGNGQEALLYSSDREGVVQTHFRWMKEYGIDGVALQRFSHAVMKSTAGRMFKDSVADRVRRAAEDHNRIFYVMYDISGHDETTLLSDIKTDWSKNVELGLDITNSPKYLRQNGKPVVAIWGFGFPDRPGTPSQLQELLNWFRGKGYYVLGGVPYLWRTQGGDVKPGWTAGDFLKFDGILPWSVGRYGSVTDIDQHYTNIMVPDQQLCKTAGTEYFRVLYPGFSWSNWNGGERNAIPRMGGDFMWRQAYYHAKLRITGMIAMFDEYDEGTAIAKAAEDASMIPTNQYFVTMDADGYKLPSDFYLRLSGLATKMILGGSPLSITNPLK